MNSQVAMFIVLLLFNCAAMFIFYRMLISRFSPRKVLAELRSEVDKLIVDLGREADRDVAILESRVKNLRSLIDEADRRILLANRETSKTEREAAVIADVRAVRPERRPIAAVDPSATQAGLPAAAPKDVAAPVTIYTRPSIKRSETQIEPFIPSRERVLEMAQRGISAEMIANTLSLPLGEVELILDMNSSSL